MQQNREPINSAQLLIDKGTKFIQGRKDSLSTSDTGAMVHLRENKNKTQKTLDLNLKLYIKINSTWITDLDVKCKITKHCRESLGYWQSILRFNTKSMIHKRKNREVGHN